MAGWKTKYDVEFKGLKEGQHEFDFEPDNTFFAHFEKSPVNVGSVAVKVILEKRGTFLKLRFKLKGWVELTCDRCLGDYRQKIKNKAEVLVKFSELEQEDQADVMWILPEEHRLNLAQLIYEYIVLSIPLKHIHPVNKKGESECDKEMLEKLNDYTIQHRGNGKEEEKIDPRWDALKKLRNNN